jgi:apolipoprotein D and lipocalin family protein
MRLAFALALALVSIFAAGCHSEPLDVASGVELTRFQGKWYEVASLPRTTQAQCTATTEFVTVSPGNDVQIVNECRLGGADGPIRSATARGTVPDPGVPAKLSVDFGGGFYGDYWILAVGPHYEWAIVGHPTRQYLWLLSRTPALDADTLHALVTQADALKFDTSKLVYTQQP